MGEQTPRTRDRGWANDPLVDLLSPHLRAAMELRAVGPTELAVALGRQEHPQTIHHLQQGEERKRCRRSRRRALAKALRVPDTWLGGEPLQIPAPIGYRLTHEAIASPRVALTLADFAEAVVMRVVADLRTVATLASRLGAQIEPADEVVQGVLAAVGDLLSLPRWRRIVVEHPRASGIAWGKESENRHQWPPVIDAPHEAAVLAQLQVWRYVLDPWLAGQAKLNYEGLLGLWAAYTPSVTAWLPDNWIPPGPDAPRATSPYAMLVRKAPPHMKPPSRPRRSKKRGTTKRRRTP